MNVCDLRSQIKKIPPEVLESRHVITPAKTKANGYPTYICPETECRNGAGGKTGDGLVVYDNPSGFSYRCFNCGKSFDNIALLALHYGLDTHGKNFIDLLRLASAEFGLNDFSNFHGSTQIKKVDAPKTQAQIEKEQADKIFEAKKIELIKADIVAARANLKNLPLDARRGLSLDTLKFFDCGYLTNWVNPVSRLQGKKIKPSRRLIIPTVDSEHYNAVLPLSDRRPANKGYWKMHAGKKALFGVQTLTDKTENIFVFEGEIDAMTAYQSWQHYDFLRFSMEFFEVDSAENLSDGSIIQKKFLPYSAFLAIGGAAENKWLDSIDNLCKQLKISPNFIIQLDEDNAGNLNAPKIQQQLRERGYVSNIQYLKEKING